MSDELTIQGVNPQQQYPVQKTSTMPYALGGAAIGAAAGWAGTSMAKSKGPAKTLEELVQEANGQDKVDLTSKKAALEKAEKELADAGKAVYDGAEKEALDKAIKARDEELAKLMETKAGGKEFNPPAWKDADIDLKEIDEVIVRTKDKKHPQKFDMDKKKHILKEDSVKKEYEYLVQEYNDAVANVERKIGSGDKAELKNKEDIIDRYFQDLRSRRAKTHESEFDKVFSTDTPSWRDKGSAHFKEYGEAQKVAERVYPKVKNTSSLTEEQIKSFAERLEGDKYKAPSIPKDYKSFPVVDEVVDGRNVKVRYVYTDEMFKDFKKLENERIVGLQDDLRTSLLSRAGENIQFNRQLADFDNNFIESIPKDRAKAAGLTDAKGKLNLSSLQAEAGKAGTTGAAGYNAGVYQSDIDKLTQLKESKGGKTKVKAALGGKKLKGSYGDVSIKEALDMATERKEILKAYNAEKRNLTDSFNSTLKDYDVLNTLRDKINETRNADEGVAKAKQALIDQFPSLADDVERVGLTEAQAMEKESYKKLAKIVEDKQAIYDKVAAEKGKINETAKKTAQDAVEKAKSELDNLVNSLNNKVKGMSGKAKAAWIAGTAIAGALIGAGIVNNKNKKAEAAARQIIA